MIYAVSATQPPISSPTKEAPGRKSHVNPTHIENINSKNMAYAPMPTIPRRATNSSSTPHRASSPIGSSFPVSRPLEGLPRRQSTNSPRTSISGLPSAGEGSSLGLKLHGSPSRPQSSLRESESPSGQRSHDEPSVPVLNFDPNFRPAKRSPTSRSPLSTPPRPGVMPRQGSTSSYAPPIHSRGHNSGSVQIPFPSSASTSELPTGSIPLSPMTFRPSTIRKKSGEIVKPSLKQRSMSTPDLMRQGHESPSDEDANSNPFGTERSKSVRFADASEGDAKALESVVLFLREQKVTAVGKAADPDGHQTETDDNDTDASDFVQFRTRKNAAARAADEAVSIRLGDASRVPRKRTDFSPDARGSLLGENVILERIELQSGVGLALRGTIIVRNVAFKKWVAVRFTLDHWQTVSEVAGNHVCHIPAGTTGDEGWDRFAFSIKLEDYKRKLEERQLILCVHYSIEGEDWWDSNDGINYNFTFKKAASRRVSRMSAASLGDFTRPQEALSSSLPGLRSNRAGLSSTQIKRAFGGPDNKPAASDWVFPKVSQRIAGDAARRPDSPLQSAPPKAFKPPAPPTIHTHLSLSKYCAPSPPQSPTKEQAISLPSGSSQDDSRRASLNSDLDSYSAHNLSPPPPVHERRSSWNGQPNGWESFASSMDEPVGAAMAEGDKTPVGTGARSPESQARAVSPDFSPPRPLTMKRSTGDLRMLVQEAEDNEGGLMTPPSSNISSPPTPLHADLPPDLLSPSLASTGESSPVNSLSNQSTPDTASPAIDIGPHEDAEEERGRSAHPKDHQFFNPGSYQEFLDKFCFFQSPSMTPTEPVKNHRPTHIAISVNSGSNSPNGFPFHQSGARLSPRTTPTPTRHFATAQEAFGFPSSGQSTPTKTGGMHMPIVHPQPVPEAALNQFVSGLQANPADTMAWGQQFHSNSMSPSLTTAK